MIDKLLNAKYEEICPIIGVLGWCMHMHTDRQMAFQNATLLYSGMLKTRKATKILKLIFFTITIICHTMYTRTQKSKLADVY
jgi:hypothetical protein